MKQKSFAKNYVFNLFYQIIAIALPLVTTPYLSRVLGADGIGRYSFAQSIVSYFALAAALGSTLYGQRLIARVSADPEARSRCFFEILLFRLLGVILATLTFCVCILPASSDPLLYAVAAIEILTVAFDITWFYQGMEDFQPIAVCTAAGRLLAMVAIFLFVKTKSDLIIYVACYCVSILVGNLFSWHGVRRYLVAVSPRSFRLRHHFLPSISLFASQFAIQIYTVLDKTMIGLITKSDFENGYYEQSQKLIKVLIALVTSLGAVMASRVAVLWRENKKNDVYRLVEGAFRFIFALGLPMAAGCILILSRFVPVFYGDGFEPVIPIIRILCIMFPIIGCSNVVGIQLLVPTGREKHLTRSVLVGAGVNVVLNAAMIPLWAALGAAIASVIAECAVTATQLFAVRREIDLRAVTKSFLRYLLLTAIMTGVGVALSRVAPDGILGIAVIVLPCVFVYGALLLVLHDPVLSFFKGRKE